ncbi:hepatoma-derived growth factor-related protein 2-like [Drosophila obscura]|uniref:hepatoma-derived growth factor-related protein 2-like n=1 Tax=Drosophila obscura TaxID=7282 RepID=UPI001BB1A50A|nr:hepatoma-derived growth factor-related protein 2-like [Drosophila obscura]
MAPPNDTDHVGVGTRTVGGAARPEASDSGSGSTRSSGATGCDGGREAGGSDGDADRGTYTGSGSDGGTGSDSVEEPAADTETATPAARPPAEAIRRSHMEQQHSRRAAAEARREEERRRGEERRREEEARRKAAEKAQMEAALNKVIMREARDALQRQMEAARLVATTAGITE